MPKTKMQGILLIGMPYVGKSTIGRKIAGILGFKFFDGDTEIEKVYPDRQKYLDEHGDDKYVDMEAKIIMKLPTISSVLAPGGSIIYSKNAKRYLEECFKVFLDAPITTIKKRISETDKRGIVRLRKKGIEKLFVERRRLYKEYSDVVINAEKSDADKIANLIVADYALKQLTKKKEDVNYISTNGKSKASFMEALKLGLAPDRGLFVPDKIPKFSKEDISLMAYLDYAQLAFVLTRQYLDIEDFELKQICEKAYGFGIPIEHYGDIYIARLDQGPSLSFKDFAMQLLAQMIKHITANKKKNLVILTATSGDTGGAVATAFSGMKKVNAVILMPKDEISEVQRKQMTTAGKNVKAVLVNGKFDDCQALAKKAFIEIKGLSSANSINIGRLMPQIVYYFYIYCQTNSDTFVVPSGNFGNLVAGVFAKRMGLPIKFIAAVNGNYEVPRLLETGIYKPVIPSKKCISNAMNVGNPSNLARLIWLYNGVMTETGKIIKMPNMKELKKDISSVSISDKETREAMVDAHKNRIILEPHGGVGWAAIEKLKHKKNLGKIVLLETAHPAKFPEELDNLGISCQIPSALSKLKNLKETYLIINPNVEELRKIINKVQA